MSKVRGKFEDVDLPENVEGAKSEKQSLKSLKKVINLVQLC